ncbi:MAG: hypothetical protein LBO74_06560 [Candidatus Symbiothrix sp.]|jgi:hypothetical protein|nr:hypothetical protein [Candidatus Symbiothrix sp.]
MRNILSSIICVCLFFSCDDQSEEITTVESKDIYGFKAIEYIEVDKDSKELIEFSKLLLRYENGSSLRQRVPIDLLSGLKNSFIFLNDNLSLYSVIEEDSIKVRIPYYRNDNELFLSEDEWLYSENLTEFSPEMLTCDMLYVEPYQKLEVECTYIMDRYTVSYRTTLVNQTTSREVMIGGKWTGTFLREIKPDYKFEKMQ